MHGYHKENGTTAGERFFGQPEKLYPLASFICTNYEFHQQATTDKGYSRKTVWNRLAAGSAGVRKPDVQIVVQKEQERVHQEGARQVVLMVDVFTNYHDPRLPFRPATFYGRLVTA